MQQGRKDQAFIRPLLFASIILSSSFSIFASENINSEIEAALGEDDVVLARF